MDTNDIKTKPKKVLLMLLPFWTPLIPPIGISSLKSFLKPHGFDVKTVDANWETRLWELYHMYFDTLSGYISEYRRGNFYNIGNYVLMNHLMAYLNFISREEYNKLIKDLIVKHFFTDVDNRCVLALDRIIGIFYERLEEYLLDILRVEKPEVVGISVYSGTLAPSVFAFQLINERFPHIQKVMGGGIFADQLALDSPSFKAFNDKFPFIDNIIIGEGELLLLKLLQGKMKEKKVYSKEDIDGEVFDISKAQILDASDFDVQKYPYISSYASRSCPFQCEFCSETVQWGKYRKKKPGQIGDEMIKLYEIYKNQLFLFGDSLLNPVVNGLAEELIRRNTSLYWDGYLRADSHVCNPENTLLWRRGGFYRARLGIESGSEKVLNLMGKKIVPHQIKSAISSLAFAGIKTTTYWVIGHPGETEQDFQMTLDLIEELKDDIYEAECNPFNYFLTGQVGSDKFANENRVYPLYDEEGEEMLVTRTWVLDTGISREETYDRVCRFVEFCKKLGIPNPYSIKEINEADERWKALHENAVPAVVEFRKKDTFVNENIYISKQFAPGIQEDDGDFNF